MIIENFSSPELTPELLFPGATQRKMGTALLRGRQEGAERSEHLNLVSPVEGVLDLGRIPPEHHRRYSRGKG